MWDYRFYLLRQDGQVLGAVEITFNDDEAAMRHARSLLPRCHSVDVIRGALVVGRVFRGPGDPPELPQPARRPNWWLRLGPVMSTNDEAVGGG